jgi:hypothetical protein
MIARLLRALDSTRPVYVAAAISLALGLFFVFVWSPLPFGWLGIDHYDDRAMRLAAGEPFDTTDVPWGYAYYLAFFYVVFGHHPWVPLVFQVLLNAGIPLLLYHLVRPLAGQRTASASALLTGVFSFNTIYASTQSSDAVCTVLFLASLLLFDRGRRSGRVTFFAVSGLLIGLALQFRPNLILFPALLAGLYLAVRPVLAGRKIRESVAYLALVAAALTPWTVRNYRLTGDFLPTSTHGGYQLWLGTLEIGDYLERRPDNPRKVFDSPSFDYTSLEHRPIEIAALAGDCDPSPTLVYWTDRDPTSRRLTPRGFGDRRIAYVIPGQTAPTAVYYYFESAWKSDERARTAFTPSRGPDDPSVYFVSTDHLGDLDRHDDLADIFDLIRLLRHQAWNEPLTDAQTWDLNDDGRLDQADARLLIQRLVRNVDPGRSGGAVTRIDLGATAVTVDLADGSTLSIPHDFDGRVTDLVAKGDLAGKLIYARESMVMLRKGAGPAGDACGSVHDIAVNAAFYRDEPHWMRRYTALAFDNIRRQPVAFAVASLYRVGRLFVIRGSSDVSTAQQFSSSGTIYRLGLAASLAVFATFLAGVVVAWRRRSPVLWLLVPIVNVPVTICFVLTNMRYSITAQPFIFVFVAITLLAAISREAPAHSGPYPEVP